MVLPSAMTWTEKSACVANLPHTNTRARFLLLAVVIGVAVLRLVLVVLLPQPPMALYNEQTKEKRTVTKSKESKELREGSFPQQIIFSSAITG